MLPLRVRIDLWAMAMKGLSTFPKAPASLEPHFQIIYCHIQDTSWGIIPFCREAIGIFSRPNRLGQRTLVMVDLTSAEKHSAYSASPVDWVKVHLLCGILPLCWEAVGLFCCPSRLSKQDTHLSLLKRSSRCTLIVCSLYLL